MPTRSSLCVRIRRLTVAATAAVLLAGCGDPATEPGSPGPGSPSMQAYLSVVPTGSAPARPHYPSPGSSTEPYPTPTPVRIAGCHPSGRAVPVGTLDPAAVRRVDRAWDRIERWLARHAPVTRRALRPPATAAQIATVQAALGRRLPDDLVASLRRHDGADFRGGSAILPPFYTPMSTAEIRSDWRTLCGIVESTGDAEGGWWHNGYTPFAQDGSGDSLVLDQRPGRPPQVGEHFHEEGTDFTHWPASLADFLEQTAQALETGRPWRDAKPAVTAGALHWEIVTGR